MKQEAIESGQLACAVRNLCGQVAPAPTSVSFDLERRMSVERCARYRALDREQRLIRNASSATSWFSRLRAGRTAERVQSAVAKFQLFLGEQQTGVLTPLQIIRLVQISAIRGSAKA
jgi:hypothetical protein